jgi:hypothetical protein
MGLNTYRQIGFVCVYRRMLVWDERWPSAGRVEHARNRKRDSESKLHVQVGLSSSFSTTLVIMATFTTGTYYQNDRLSRASDTHRQ